MIDLLSAQPWLAHGTPPALRDAAHRRARACGLYLRRGDWDGPAADLDGGFGVLVVDGVVARRMIVPGGRALELLGEGELLRPWDPDHSASATGAAWEVLTSTAQVAVLDAAFARRVAPLPNIAANLVARAEERAERLALLLALRQCTRVERRLILLFWHLSDRWGRVTPEGTVLRLPRLTHCGLGEMIGARRPSVTTALGRLARRGTIEQRGQEWLLHGTLDDALAQDEDRESRLASRAPREPARPAAAPIQAV